MEGAHGELRAGLADGLGCHDTDWIPNLYRGARAHVPAVALLAQAVPRFAGERGAQMELRDRGRGQEALSLLLIYLLVAIHQHLARLRVDDRRSGKPPNHLIDALLATSGIGEIFDPDTRLGSAIFVVHDQALRDVDQTARQVSRVRRLDRRVSQSFSSSMRREEILEHGQSVAEARFDRQLDDSA